MTRARPLGSVLLAAALLTAGSSAAHADGLPAEARAALERAFVEGRYDDLEAALPLAAVREPRNRYPLEVRDRLWRLREGGAAGSGPPPVTPEALADWPLVTALVLERGLRESSGARRLLADSPLLKVPDPDGALAATVVWQTAFYRAAPPEDSPDLEVAVPARAARDRAEGLRRDALLLASLALTGLLSLGLLAAWRLGRPDRS